MKRTLRQSAGKQQVKEAELNSEQQQQLDKLKNIAGKYEGKSEEEVFKDLSDTVKKGKAEGTITNEKIDNIASTIAPMLDNDQKKKLNELMKMLKK